MSIIDILLPEIVLVEDSMEDELMSLRGISKSGIPCNVTVRRDGEEALDHLLSAHNYLPRLILLDLHVPKVSGLEILTRLRAQNRTRLVPIVMFSGSNSGPTLQECYRCGANSCVTKPSSAKEYVDRLTGITQYWLTMNETPGYSC